MLLLFFVVVWNIFSFHLFFFYLKASLNEAPREIGKYWMFVAPYAIKSTRNNYPKSGALEMNFINF